MLRFLLIYFLCWSAFAQTRIQENVVEIGRKTSTADKQIKLHKGDGSFAIIEWDGASNKFKQSLDNGVSFKDFGAGEGSTGGLQVLSNAGFEDGITSGWTSSVGDTSELVTAGCTLGTNCPLQGEKSIRFNPSAQNDYFESSLATLPEALYGVACEARFKYIGGDTNLSAYVINGDGETVGQYRNQSGVNQLPAHSIAGYESVYFLCPSKASVVADNDKGELKIKINNDGASAAVDADYDDFYLGNLLGLSESVLPDVFSARIANGGSASVTSQNVNFIQSVNRASLGIVDITFVSGIFTVIPSIHVTADNSVANVYCEVTSLSITSARTRCVNDNSVFFDRDISVTVKKQGADAKQSVQVFKSIPKVADNENNFSAFISSTGVVSNENTDWINGNCTISETARYTCNYISTLGLTVPMNCVLQSEHNLGSELITVLTNSTTQNAHYTYAPGGSQVQQDHWIFCQKAGADYKTPVVQPILVNQVLTVNQRGVVGSSCRIDNNGTATINDFSGLCAGFISSVNRTAAGIVEVTFASTLFPVAPNCQVTARPSSDRNCFLSGAYTNLLVRVRCDTATSGGATDTDFFISCEGVR